MKNEIKFLGENLYKFRKEKGISQEELANKIGVSRQAVYKWETGERIPDISNLNALCMEFNKKIEDFIEGAEFLNKIENDYNDKANANENKSCLKKDNLKVLKKTLNVLIIMIILIYILSVIIKAIFFSNMFAKIDRYKGANNYSYHVRCQYNIKSTAEITEGKYILRYKDGVQNIADIGNNDKASEVWSYYKTADKKETYVIEVSFNNENPEEKKYYYSYIKGFNYYKEDSPYELVSEIAKKNYNIKNILNPLYIVNIDKKNNNLILEDYDKDPEAQNQVYVKRVYCIDLKTGLLSKEEVYELDKLISRSVYFNYEFDKINYVLELSDEMKYKIIEESKRQEEELLRQEEMLNKEN